MNKAKNMFTIRYLKVEAIRYCILSISAIACTLRRLFLTPTNEPERIDGLAFFCAGLPLWAQLMYDIYYSSGSKAIDAYISSCDTDFSHVKYGEFSWTGTKPIYIR